MNCRQGSIKDWTFQSPPVTSSVTGTWKIKTNRTWSLPLPTALGESCKQVTTTQETEEGMRIKQVRMEWLTWRTAGGPQTEQGKEHSRWGSNMCKGREGSKDSKDDVQPLVHTQTLPRQHVPHSPAIHSSTGFIFLETSSCSSYSLKSIVIEPPWHSSPWRIKGCCSLPVSGEVRLGFEKDNSTVILVRAP